MRRLTGNESQVRPFRLAVFVGLVAGLAENGARLVNAVLQHRPLNYSHHIWWTTPLVEVLLLLTATAVLVLTARVVPVLRRPRVLLTLLLFLGWLTPLLLAPRLATWARVILAAGLAVSTAEILARRLEIADRLQRGLLPAALVLTVAIAAAVEFAAYRRHRDGLGARGAARAGAPNVLVLLWDTVRGSSLSLHGAPRRTTPHLDAFARGGVVFDRAVTTAPFTLPAHASLFTGRWAHELPTTWREPLDDSTPTLATAFRAAGYRTAAFSANRYYVTREYGLARGFEHFDQHALRWRQILRSSTLLRIVLTSEPVRRLSGFDDDLGRATARDSHRGLIRWLERDSGRPFFAFVNYMEAHAPYLPPAPFDTAFGWYSSTTSAQERWRLRALARRDTEQLPPAEVARLERAYEGAIASLDAAVDSLLGELATLGHLRNTIVVILSDHGEEFGEHGVAGHGNSLYFDALHVPLVIVAPGRVPEGRRVGTAVSIKDVGATLLDLAGAGATLAGESLARHWRAGTDLTGDSDPSPAFAELVFDPGLPQIGPVTKGHMIALVNDSIVVIRNGDGSLEAFDLREDPRGRARVTLDSAGTAAALAAMPRSRR